MSGPGGKLSARERDMMRLVQALREAGAALTRWRFIAAFLLSGWIITVGAFIAYALRA